MDDFVENQVLKDFDQRDPADQKLILYGLGRLPLEEVQSLVEASIPEQDQEGRYITDNPVGGFPDALMRDIHMVSTIQEKLSSILQRRPQRPFTFVPVWTPQEMEQRIRARDWERAVWGAGSHTSCDINILYMNVEMGLEDYRPALDAARAVCNAYQNPLDGMWGLPENRPHMKVNGTMKVLSRYHYIQECHLPFADRMIDYVLDYCDNVLLGLLTSHVPRDMACNIIDVLFCLKYAAKMTDHRSEDIKEHAFALFDMVDKLHHTDDEAIIGLLLGAIRRAASLCVLAHELGWPEKVYRFPRVFA